MARAAKPCKCWRALPVTGIAVARARTGSRIASCAASGSQTDEPIPEARHPPTRRNL
jgi:hypothetical protein